MIGVVADLSKRAIVEEFFELFKTPWEFYEKGRDYDVLLCSGDDGPIPESAKITLIYSGNMSDWDSANHVEIIGRSEKATLSTGKSILPIFGACLLFPRTNDSQLLIDNAAGHPAVTSFISRNGHVFRIGYNLFDEIGHLLRHGQPAEFAGVPTLELHISLLREWIVSAGATLTEIPAVPEGYKFIVCLTHDVDHPSIRRHKWDRTIVGFLYRATVGSLLNFLKHAISLRELLINWTAALRLPLVYLGLAEDFWQDFTRRYQQLEQGLVSTYFIIPFQGRPGRDITGMAPSYRAAQYGADDITASIAEISANGGEVGLHGIDAWIDGTKGKEEAGKIEKLTGGAEIGSRMHWLFFNEDSPSVLEQAGISYDSTCGYRETVGFRNGTTQAYKPIQAERILELPLHVMDTALFYPAYLGLSSRKASQLLATMADLAEQFGGCLTINWHDRSLSPERQWDKCYSRLLDDLKARGAWFGTAGQVVAWFRKRRSVAMRSTQPSHWLNSNGYTNGGEDDRLPGLQIRIHSRELKPDRPEYLGVIDVPFSSENLGRVLCTTGK